MSKIKPELTAEVESEITEVVEPEITIECQRVECQAECDELDAAVVVVNQKIADARREKDALLAEKDRVLLRLADLRPKPAEEIQRHLQAQNQARADRQKSLLAAAAAVQSVGGLPVLSPVDAAMKHRPRQNGIG